MTDYTSISVPQDVKDVLEDDKPEDVGWGDYLTSLKDNSAYESNDGELTTTVEVDAESIADQLLGELADELEINVNMDESQEMSEDDVRTMIQSEIDALKRELR